MFIVVSVCSERGSTYALCALNKFYLEGFMKAPIVAAYEFFGCVARQQQPAAVAPTSHKIKFSVFCAVK